MLVAFFRLEESPDEDDWIGDISSSPIAFSSLVFKEDWEDAGFNGDGVTGAYDDLLFKLNVEAPSAWVGPEPFLCHVEPELSRRGALDNDDFSRFSSSTSRIDPELSPPSNPGETPVVVDDCERISAESFSAPSPTSDLPACVMFPTCTISRPRSGTCGAFLNGSIVCGLPTFGTNVYQTEATVKAISPLANFLDAVRLHAMREAVFEEVLESEYRMSRPRANAYELDSKSMKTWLER
jgi:hypothetical protein